MKIIALLLLTVLGILGFAAILSCGSKGTPPTRPTTDPALAAHLEAKFEIYRALINTAQDQHGFIESTHCDSLLFTGLLGTALAPEAINILAARGSNNQWFRRPITTLGEDPCYPNNSKSSISRDMFLGVLWYIWVNKRLDLASDLWDYGKLHTWVMGEGDLSRTVFTPNMQTLLAKIIYRLGGKDHFVTKNLPIFRTKDQTGFAAHLTVLSILLYGEVEKEITANDLGILTHHFNRQPLNTFFNYAFHKYTDGVQNRAISELLEETYFPADTLPTSAQRDEAWLWQRDYGKDWKPRILKAEEPETWSGGEFLFLASLILSDIRSP